MARREPRYEIHHGGTTNAEIDVQILLISPVGHHTYARGHTYGSRDWSDFSASSERFLLHWCQMQTLQ